MRSGFKIELVLLQIWLVLMPSSSRRGGSSPKWEFDLPMVLMDLNCGVGKGVDAASAAADDPTSKDMKGIELGGRG